MQNIVFKQTINKAGKDYNLPELPAGFKVKIWTPGISKLIPESYPLKYFVLWVFHYFGVFKNKNYSAILIYNKGKVVSCILAIPKYFKWPFMNNNDVQIAYVITDSEYRGKGLAAHAIVNALKYLSKSNVKNVWYVTSKDNESSIRLARKLGFESIGYGKRKYKMKVFRTLELQENVSA